jgi:RimJ/RimL family protein N-acetyltransferase
MRGREIRTWIRVKLQNTREYYEKYGLWKSILHFFERIGLGYIKRSLIFFELNMEDWRPYQEKDPVTDFVKVEKEDLAAVDEYFDGWFDKEHAIRRLEAGHVLFAIKHKGRMIFFQWLEFQKVEIPFLELSFCIPDKTACMAYIYTVPEFRGKGVASKAKPLVLDYLRQCGYQRVFLEISPKNPISQRVNKKFGFKEYQTVIFRKFSFLRYYSVKDYYTSQRRIFWHVRTAQQRLWNTFSKIGHD